METIIVTDSCCDLPYSYIKENYIQMISMNIEMNEIEKKDDLAKTKEYEAFYESILNGLMPKTSQINTFEFKEIFEKYIKEGKSILYIGFSSALSGCVNSAYLAEKEVKGEYPDAQIVIVDSKCASMGQGLLIYYAVEAFKQGKSLEEVVSWIEQNKLKLNHWFTVTDLNYLFRGGRVSKTAATLGTLLQIKPILHVDDEGRLIPVEKVKGRKKSLKALVEKVKENIVEPENQIIFISHGGVLEEAHQIKKAILEECHVKDVWINYIGAAVGSHAGPGTIAIFFMGEKR
ncbi:MAG: DegV family protein [Cellulosilyticum sp.]|nr:DegV family protein [Cellulosilyticum sp.]MEE1073420.1 DegV family protein [Cellulosilyticum sp.]